MGERGIFSFAGRRVNGRGKFFIWGRGAGNRPAAGDLAHLRVYFYFQRYLSIGKREGRGGY